MPWLFLIMMATAKHVAAKIKENTKQYRTYHTLVSFFVYLSRRFQILR